MSCSLQVIFPSYSLTCFDIVCNGALNWIAESIEESDKDITAIDISSVKLREGIELPCKPNICYMEMFKCKLLAFNGVLYYATQTFRDEFDFWLLKDWVKPIWIKKFWRVSSSIEKFLISCNIPKWQVLSSRNHDTTLPEVVYLQCEEPRVEEQCS